MKKLNLQIRDIFIILLAGLLIWQIFFTNNNSTKEIIKPVIVNVPEKIGTSGLKTIETIKTVPVIIPKTNEKIIVDSTYEILYRKAADTIEKQKLYLKAIEVKNYKKDFIDNDTIKISGDLKTRGDLISYKIDYKIKQSSIQVEPQVIYKKPSLSLGFGVETGIPTFPNTNFIMKGSMSLENYKGNGLSIGYDTDRRIWLGVSKKITLKK